MDNEIRQQLTDHHSFGRETLFHIKTIALTFKRFAKNLLSPIEKFKANKRLIHEPIIAISESELWNPNDNEKNWILTAGKVQNLRIATKRINGIEVKANQTFSFWKHIGNPNFGKGYVGGREIREGCIVPTIAGGLCQLSNALYDAALKANFEIVERHKHTKIIQGSFAEQDRDATVKWNYIDLRFKSKHDFRIETELTTDKLIVSFKSKHTQSQNSKINTTYHQSDKLNDCFSCGNTTCFKHPKPNEIKQNNATTTLILDEKWTEYDQYLATITNEMNHFILPLKKNYFIKTDRYQWENSNIKNTSTTTLQGIYRALKLRFAPRQNNTFELSLKLDEKIAIAAAKKIPIDSTHLVISQNLLPFIYKTGVLGGRTFDVLMTRLPFEKLHERLDLAQRNHPQSTTLTDFRVSQELINLENTSLTKARKIITPHNEIAEIFINKVQKLNWHIPEIQPTLKNGKKILFPASAVGRKGAYEMKQLAQELNLELSVFGRTIEHPNFWENVKIEKFNGNFNEIGLIVYPTYIEHQPRLIIKGISKGIPVITTTATGLNSSELVKTLPIGDLEQFKIAIINWRTLKNT